MESTTVMEQPKPTEETVAVVPTIEDTVASDVTAVHLEEIGCMGSTYGCCSDETTPREGTLNYAYVSHGSES